MTIMEAFNQAMREVGMSEEEIKTRAIHADMQVGRPMPQEIPAGHEREIIDALKTAYRKAMALSPKQKAAVKRALDARTRQLNSMN